jgi:glycosyltransferase involved in cell wall biosynthesis
MSYHEGLPRIVLESLYVGLYTLSNKLPGLMTIFEENDNGKLITNNSLDEFKEYIFQFRDIEQNEEKVVFSRTKIESNFSTNKILKEFVKVYEQL